jgi:hypothetical protein
MIPERLTLLTKPFLLIALLAAISTQAAAPTNGLVAYYPFNGNANDASGHNLNGRPSTQLPRATASATPRAPSFSTDQLPMSIAAIAPNGNSTAVFQLWPG